MINIKKALKNAVFYEIYPQSFKDSNGDGIGDFNGIIEKLDYIKDTGFTAIWMNPCYESPFADAGYDVSNFYKTAERYGSNMDLKRLIDEVHKRGMSLILDLVPGHTSIECSWFKESMKAEKNKYSDRYIWTDNIWKDCTGEGIAGSLRGISERSGSCAVNFFTTQPALNYGFAEITDDKWQKSVDSEEAISTREELLNIIRFWLELGCDGFRVDMAGSLVKLDKEQKETIKLWQKILGVINKEFPEAIFISEWGDPARALESGFDMDFLLHFGPSHYLDMYHSENAFFSRDGKGSAKEFFEHYIDCLERTNGKGFMGLPSGNHDMERISYYCDETEIKLVYAFMMSMPGVPFIYYGDEIGMNYVLNLTSVEGGYNRTGSRTPMQWNDDVNCGFSSADKNKLYISQDNSAERPTVKKSIEDENSILNELKKQISVRKNYVSLQESSGFELINSDYPLVYKRFTDDEHIIVAINPTIDEKSIELGGININNCIYSYNGTAIFNDGKLIIPPMSASYLHYNEIAD